MISFSKFLATLMVAICSYFEPSFNSSVQISVEVSGNKTQRIFDDVFKKMVAAAQPIPGFRRVKGGGVFMRT